MRRFPLVFFLLLGVAHAEGVSSSDTSSEKASSPAGELKLEVSLKPTAGKIEGGARALAFSTSGKLAYGGVDGWVGVNERGTTLFHNVVTHEASVNGLVFHNEKLISVSDDGTVAVSDGASVTTRSLNLGALTSVASWEKRIAIGTWRGAIALVDPETGKIEKTIERHNGSVVALLPVGSKLASASWDGTVKLTDASGRETAKAKVGDVELTSLALSPDNKMIAVGSWKKGVALLDATTLKLLATLEPHKGGAIAVALSAGRLVSASIADERVVVSEPLGAKPAFKLARASRLSTVPSTVAVATDGRIAVATNDGAVLVYAANGGAP